MKRKIIYSLILCCNLCLLSFATGNKLPCNIKCRCASNTICPSGQTETKETGGLGFDLSPIHFFIPEV